MLPSPVHRPHRVSPLYRSTTAFARQLQPLTHSPLYRQARQTHQAQCVLARRFPAVAHSRSHLPFLLRQPLALSGSHPPLRSAHMMSPHWLVAARIRRSPHTHHSRIALRLRNCRRFRVSTGSRHLLAVTGQAPPGSFIIIIVICRIAALNFQQIPPLRRHAV